MSIIKGTNQIVAGFGGTKRCIGEVYFSQSSLATDNPGALPGWTGEYYENGKTLFPDLYNFVKAHSELQVTKAQYDSAITTYGECPKYVIDENGASTTVLVPGYVWNVTNTGATNFRVVTKTRNPVAGDPIWVSTEEQLSATGVSGLFDFSLDGDGIVYSCANDTLIVQQAAPVFGEWDPAVSGDDATSVFSKEQASLGEIQVIVGTSLRLPKYANYIKMANSTEGIKNIEAGLPNIDSDTNWVNVTGGTETTATNTNVLSDKGAFGGTNSQGGHGIKGNDFPINWRRFDASLSNSIYGKSSTVTPASTTLYPWVVAYTAAIPASTAQAAEFQQGLSGKADTNLGNLSTAGKDLASGLGMPSNRYIDLTLGASGSTYTAPANGYFCLKGNSGINGNFQISFYNQTANFRQTVSDNNWADWVSTYIPAKKGDVANLLYTNVTAASHSFLFIYAEGAE